MLIRYNEYMNLTDRQELILNQIIEEYAETASPVGSVTIAKLFDVSPATVRAEMGRLESLGLIAQPHTSAGRVPTDAGYRYYVNHLDANCDVIDSAVDDFYDTDASYVAEMPEVREIEGRGVASDGMGMRRQMHAMERKVTSQSQADAAIRSAVDTLVDLTGNLGLATIGGQLYLAGMSRLFTQPEFGDTGRVRAVAKLLDNLEPWLREAAPGKPLNIFIGQENPIGRNSGVSLIISKFRSPFSDKSYIGVLGPTRQNYARVMALVRNAGNLLEDIL